MSPHSRFGRRLGNPLTLAVLGSLLLSPFAASQAAAKDTEDSLRRNVAWQVAHGLRAPKRQEIREPPSFSLVMLEGTRSITPLKKSYSMSFSMVTSGIPLA